MWNAYNRQPIYLKAGDSTASWQPTTTLAPANANTANSLTVFTGLAEEPFDLKFFEKASIAANNSTITLQNAIGWNSTTAGSGLAGAFEVSTGGAVTNIATVPSEYLAPPNLGINTVTALEQRPAGGSVTVSGTEASMILSAQWRG